MLRPRGLATLLCLCAGFVFLLLSAFGGSPSPVNPLPAAFHIHAGAALENPEFPLTPHDCPPTEATRPTAGLASTITPAELLCRRLPSNLAAVPKLFHQSWKATELPAKFQRWSTACREKHPDWEWVLWTDEDNLQLVSRYFPWLRDTYLALPGNIYRVDLARNLYMYLFGGVYADLDTECLRTTSDVFDSNNIALVDATENTPSSDTHMQKVAIFGSMGADSTFEHHIPNAWMAASPRHPLFLLPLESAMAEVRKSRSIIHKLWYDWPSAEQMTGPIALRRSILAYNSSGNNEDELVVLPEHLVYPFNWNSTDDVRAICSAEQHTFDAERCKDILEVDAKGSISITYWSHTHRGHGSDAANIELVSHND